MRDKIKIDIISDVMCPWCIVGYKRLEIAMKELGLENKFEIEWHPFELNPDMPSEGENYIEHIGHKYSLNAEQIQSSTQAMKKNFEEVDFPFDFYKERRVVNTRDAHVLLAYAQEEGKQTELEIAFFKANFAQRKDVSDHKTLVDIATSVGLDEEVVKTRLDDLNARKKVQDNEDFWKEKGVSLVPTMIFNHTKRMNGAYSVENYKQILKDLLK